MSEITKHALENSLKTLLLKKPFNKITIRDLTNDCGINRMTFYYHFEDIYDLVEWSCREEAFKALENYKTASSWHRGFIKLLMTIKENKECITNLVHCIDQEEIEKHLGSLIQFLLLNVIEQEAGNRCINDEDKNFIAKFYSYCFIGLLLDWIKNGMIENPDILALKMSEVMDGSIKRALNKFEIHQN